MKHRILRTSFLAATLAGGIALTAHGNVIIEPFGLLKDNFSGTPRAGDSPKGTAPGLSGVAHGFGSTTSDHDYKFSFTPGVDLDNYLPAPGTDYGNGDLASGLSQLDLSDGGTGTYRVYATWVPTSNVSGGLTTYTISNDADPLTFSIDQNGSAYSDPVVDSAAPGANKWVFLGTVELTAGNTYSVVQSPTENTWVSHRTAGIMFEPIPEPSTYAAIFGGIALLGAFIYRRRIGSKK